ncbi:MAG: hypothetical protein KAI57_03970 [Candidatus Pacebacteria bacterium]|nr:hypothetical protein [Candidatus Paceibacterota bacterium]
MRNIRKNKRYRKQKYDFRKKKNRLAVNYKKALVVIFLLTFFYFLFFSSFFQIDNIEIEGNQGIAKDSIKNIVNDEMSKSAVMIFSKNNFFLASKTNIEEKLFFEFSEIENVKIKKIFPKILRIEIIEKTPLIIWCRLNQCYYLDDDGIAFATEEANYEDVNDEKFIKIIEQLEIEEEILEKKNRIAEDSIESKIKYIEDDDGKWEVNKDLHGREFYEKKIGENETKVIYLQQETVEEMVEDVEEKTSLKQININDQVSDRDFIDFALEINNEIQQINNLKIKYYKTKGIRTRQLIAYTDKNVRIYFNTMSSAKLQAEYLNEFLSKAISKNEINTIEYIYLESGNKIFYK